MDKVQTRKNRRKADCKGPDRRIAGKEEAARKSQMGFVIEVAADKTLDRMVGWEGWT
jgi:hypothetical protein